MKFIEIQGQLINLKNVTTISKFGPTDHYKKFAICLGLSGVGEDSPVFEFRQRLERDAEWNRLRQILLDGEAADE